MSTARAHLALFTVNVIYGANYVVAKGVMGTTIAPSGFMLVRAMGAVLLFWSLRAVLRERIAMADLPRLLICAVFGVALNGTLFLHGLMRTSPAHAGILMVATPILVLVLSGLLIGERITRTKLAGILLGAGGAVLLIVQRGGEEARGSSALGDVFILINAVSYALFLVLAKPLLARYSAITLMSWVFLIGLFLILPFGWRDVQAVPWRSLSTFELGSIAFVVVMVTFVAYLLKPGLFGS
jgi:drug/metabolite transporter (DMT)-like permease